MDVYAFGYTPGPIAVMIASGWIAYIVVMKKTLFPKWFALCTPLVTLTWVAVAGWYLMPEPLGIYFLGAFGTWILLFMNLAASWTLWNIEDGTFSKIVRDGTKGFDPTWVSPPRNYRPDVWTYVHPCVRC